MVHAPPPADPPRTPPRELHSVTKPYTATDIL